MPADPPESECVVCETSIPVEDMVRFGERHVCADCKPRYVQALKEGVDPIESTIWRKGKFLVLKAGEQLPDRCVVCNTEAQSRDLKIRQLQVFLTRAPRNLEITIPLCSKHRTHRRRATQVGLVMLVVGILAAALFPSTILGVIGPGTAILGLVVLLISMSAPLTLYHSTKDHVVLSGAKKPFLQSLPEFTETESWWHKSIL